MIQLRACRICSVFVYRMMTSKISIQDGIRSFWERVRCLRKMFSKVCAETDYKVWTTSDSVCDVQQRIEWRSRGAKLSKIEEYGKTTHWLDGTDTKFQSPKWKNWRNVSAERKVGQRFQWKASGQCSRGDSCSFFNHGSHSGPRAQLSSSTPRGPTQTDGESLIQVTVPEEKVLPDWKAKERVKTSWKESARNRRVIYGTVPYA